METEQNKMDTTLKKYNSPVYGVPAIPAYSYTQLDIFKWHRDYLKGEEKKGLHYNLPIEQKESNRWLESYRKTQEIADEFPESTVINIADREGDIYEIFLEYDDTQSKNKCEYLIRACQNRCVMPVADDVPGKLQEQVSATPVLGELKFQTPSGRGKKSRTVRQSVQATELILQPPKSSSQYMSFVSHFWSSKHHRVVKGINLITLYYTDPSGQHQPVNFRIYDKAEGKTKNNYFQEMLNEVISWGLKPAFVTGDAWYSGTPNLKKVKNHQGAYVCCRE